MMALDLVASQVDCHHVAHWADLAARLRAQEPQLARELRKLLQEIETAS